MLNKGKETFLTKNLRYIQLTFSHISDPGLNLGPVEGDRLIFVSSLYSPISNSGLLVKCLIYFKAKWKVTEQGKFYKVPIASDWAG